jgi:hypothetical protein
MADDPVVPVEGNGEAELEKLRHVNAELVARHARDKQKLAELEQGSATLQAKLTETSDSLYQATVGVPLQMMASEMSTVPDLFLEQFSKHFKVASVKGVLTLQTPDGRPALDRDGKAIPWDRQALTELLTTGNDARAKTFRAITIVNRASGAAGVASTTGTLLKAPVSKAQFGLRCESAMNDKIASVR